MIISELYRYPLKSGKGEALPEAPLLATGFPDDRRWLLVDALGRFISQREYAKMAFIQTRVDDRLHFHYQDQTLAVDRAQPGHPTLTATVWADTVPAWDLGDEAAAFFSSIMQQEVRLCEAMPEHARHVDTKYTETRAVDYFFADAFPYLVISQESLDLLNEKLQASGETPVTMDRFRPNIVIKGWEPHAEDEVQTLSIGGRVELRLTKLCSRCNVTTIDQTTAESGSEPLRTLARYRKLGTSKIYFGMNAWVLSGAGSMIQLGDQVTVESR
ncbi:MAG TPA: MOSC N-terminal beta barrel domain-containing protein [Oligoflexus sp.]|uniref:MOSC domain-containing protein n=1 Tax=Oligoflexus sp. TaxID=1971216 RepID=UPI002D2F8AC9|nr:MOSC N-terminal beta barrel domain-containing protein [Oligoflexus sp.]HYX37493.1 MOSC N-terminal beta barrel domain-containing protein [Oligoflexus sp.]